MKESFLELLLNSQVLKFGSFQTKSGRMSPYFFNTGHLDSGLKMGRAAAIYAEKIHECFPKASVLYGPAYKGIPLCVSIADRSAQRYGKDMSFTFNRKEVKDHGEGGNLIGHKIEPGDQVVIVEDVISAGTSLRESMVMLKEMDIEVVGAVVGVDRQEQGIRGLSARKEIQDDFQIEIQSILSLDEIVQILYGKEFLSKLWINDDMKDKIDTYRSQYGA